MSKNEKLGYIGLIFILATILTITWFGWQMFVVLMLWFTYNNAMSKID